MKVNSLELTVENYDASGGQEYFISLNSKDGKTLFGFLRLFLPGRTDVGVNKKFNNSAIIREVHVYGELVSVGSKKKTQHSGLGKQLMSEAEKIANEWGRENMVVISGVGVRGYYRKLGYKLKETYMVRKLT